MKATQLTTQTQMVTIEPHVAEAVLVLNVGMGFQLSPADARGWSLILAGFDADVLRFAALEYSRQRSKPPTHANEIAQFCGWIKRAIENAQAHYTHAGRQAAAADTFNNQFVAACGNDTRAFISAGAHAPHAAAADDDDDRADLMRRIELTRTRIAQGRFVDAQYGRDYLAHLEAQL